jgi:hypothetical protein
MAKVTKEELMRVMWNFQKDKSSGPDGITMEFHLGCYDFLGDDLLKMAKYFRTSRKILVAFNAIFIVVIPKSDNPRNFDLFKPISLCNNIYKIISKLIAIKLKDLLSDNIYFE